MGYNIVNGIWIGERVVCVAREKAAEYEGEKR